LVVFPELASIDRVVAAPGGAGERSQWDKVAREDAPRFFEASAAIARRHGVALLSGTFPRFRDSSTIVNTACFSFADGRAQVLRDKIFVTAWERASWRWQDGGGELEPFDAPWGSTVIATCYDVEFPGLSNRVARARPELWLVPSCTEAVHGYSRVRWCAQARAVEHHAYVVHTGTVGQGHYGQASVFTPCEDGFPHVAAEGPRNVAGIVYAELDLERLRESRRTARAYPARDQLERGP
jgi:predicted amidohydrolase